MSKISRWVSTIALIPKHMHSIIHMVESLHFQTYFIITFLKKFYGVILDFEMLVKESITWVYFVFDYVNFCVNLF